MSQAPSTLGPPRRTPPRPSSSLNNHRPEEGGAFAVGGPALHSWRETALTRVTELRSLTAYFGSARSGTAATMTRAIHSHLDAAEEAAAGSSSVRSMIYGSNVERTKSNLDAAEADLLRIAPTEFVTGQLQSLLAGVRQHLPRDDPRRQHLEQIAARGATAPLTSKDRNAVISAVRGASSEARREGARVRSFRNVLLATAALIAAAALGLALLGLRNPQLLPICFRPEGKVVCPTQEVRVPGPQAQAGSASSPAQSERVATAEAAAVTGGDVPLIELLGLIAAAIAGAAALRDIRGTSTPYSVPIALAVLKLPTGAITAVLGLLLMRGQFVPGLSALDLPAQILAWAIVFGYAQQLFTRFVDQQGARVLDSVGGPRSAT